jgi:hypothetical protein
MNGDKFFNVWFVFCALLSLAVTGVGIWALVTVVQWLVTK